MEKGLITKGLQEEIWGGDGTFLHLDCGDCYTPVCLNYISKLIELYTQKGGGVHFFND